MVDEAIGGDSGVDQNGTDFAGQQTSEAAAEPSVIEIPDENALIRVKGSDKPVKYGEHIRGFQSQFTKASQRAAQLERQLQERDAALQRLEQERRMSQQAQQGQQGDDIFSALAEMPYLTGKDAAGVLQHIVGQVTQRYDTVLMATLKQLQDMKRVVGTLNETHSTSTFDAKINKWLEEGCYPKEYANLAKEIYLAYEGDDLDYEFPRIFQERVAEIEAAMEARKRQAVERSRSRFVPGRGGQAGPSKPLQFTGKETPDEMAEALWPGFQRGPGT